MKTETREVYVADDGALFSDADACADHEKRIRDLAAKTSYWAVIHNPDLDEGRGYYGRNYIECFGPEGEAELLVKDWCYRTYGSPAAFVQGCSLMENWSLARLDKGAWIAAKKARVGDCSYPFTRTRLVIGSKPPHLIEDKDQK